MAVKIKTAPTLRHFGDSLVSPGAGRTAGWNDTEDNPMSPMFKPLDQRTEQDKTRWWARHGRRKSRDPAAGVYG